MLKPPTNSPIENHPLLPIPRPVQQNFQNFLSNLYNPIANIHLPTLLLPTYSPFNNERSTNNSPDNIQFSEELDSFLTLQQQLRSPHTVTIHQLSSTITSSIPPTPTPISDYTPSLAHSSTSTESSNSTNRAYRTFKRKFPNHPFPSKPGTAREYINHITIPRQYNEFFSNNSTLVFPIYTKSVRF